MRSIRLDTETSSKIDEVAGVTGDSPADVVRRAVRLVHRQYVTQRADIALAPYIGRFASTAKARARTSGDSGDAFGRLLRAKAKKGRK